jgi:hypothetical protein
MGAAPTSAPRCCAAPLFSACPSWVVFRTDASSRVAPLVCALCAESAASWPRRRNCSLLSLFSPHVSRVAPRPASAAGEAPVAVSRHYDAGVVALVAAGVRVACRSTSPGGASLALPPWLSALGTWLVALGSWLLACARRAVPANDPDLYTQRAYTCFECQCGRVRFTLCTSCPRRCCPSVRFRVSARAQVLRRRAEG